MKTHSFLTALFCFLSSLVAVAQTEQTDSIDQSLLIRDLPEVMVKGEQPVAKLERGRLTYNMPLLLKQIPADNAFEALRNIPGVTVDNGSVSFAGQPITLVIDGKPTTMSQEQIVERLKMMPADRMANAQVMLSAPASLHVRGAVINIGTKSFTKHSQTSGQVAAMWNQSKYGTGTGKWNLLYSASKLMFDASYKHSQGDSYGEAEHSALHPLNGERVEYYDLTTNKTFGKTHDYRAGLDYQFAKNHQLSVAYTGFWRSYDSNNKSIGDSRSAQNSIGENYMHNFDADYTLPFGLRLSASYLKYEHSKDQKLDGSIFQTNKNLTANSNQAIGKWLFTADQSHSLKRGWGLSYGAKAQFATNNSYQTTTTDQGIQLPEATSSVSIDERIINGYAGFSKQWSEKLSMEASLTVENFHTPQWNEWRVYPSANVLWVADDDNLFNLSFSSDARYPSYWSTMNSVHYSSTYSEIWGNPYLKPGESYDISLVWQWKRRYTLSAFATLRPNEFVQLPYQPTDRMAVIMKEVNFDYRNTFGLQAGAQYKAGAWLNGNISVAALYNHDKCDDFFDIPFNRCKMAFVVTGTASALLSKRANIRFIINPFFQSGAVQGVYDIKSMFSMNSSLRWASKDDRWNITLAGNNLTNRHFRTGSTWQNQNFHMSVCQDWTNVQLSVICKFGNYKEKKVKKADTSRMGY